MKKIFFQALFILGFVVVMNFLGLAINKMKGDFTSIFTILNFTVGIITFFVIYGIVAFIRELVSD